MLTNYNHNSNKQGEIWLKATAQALIHHDQSHVQKENMGTKTKYTFENIVNNPKIRQAYFRDYSKLIQSLRAFGYNAAALKHARNKKRIEEELSLFD